MSALPFVYIDEAAVGELLTWPLVFHAVEQALLSMAEPQQPPVDDQQIGTSSLLPHSVQKPRTITTLPSQGS